MNFLGRRELERKEKEKLRVASRRKSGELKKGAALGWQLPGLALAAAVRRVSMGFYGQVPSTATSMRRADWPLGGGEGGGVVGWVLELPPQRRWSLLAPTRSPPVETA